MPAETFRVRVIRASDPPPSDGPSPTALKDIRTLVSEAFSSWAEETLETVSERTRERYVRDVRQFLAFAGIGPENLHELLGVRPRDIAAWQASLRAAKASRSAIRQKMTALRSFFRELAERRYIRTNPVRRVSIARSGRGG